MLAHTLDLLYRKWGGFIIFELAKAGGLYGKTLENKNYHKRRFVLVTVVVAILKAYAGEVRGEGASNLSGSNDVLSRLKRFIESRKNKLFGQWMEFVRVDAMTYFALYVSMRVGDLSMRESAMRTVASLVIGYGTINDHFVSDTTGFA